MEALAKLGINGWMLLFQAINFAILLFVLSRFAYRPMIQFLDERATKIQQGIADAEKAKIMLEEVAKKEGEMMQNAQKEAKKILQNADEQAKKRADSLVLAAENSATKLLEDARLQATAEAEKLLHNAKEHLSELVILAVEKVIQQKMDTPQDEAFIQKIIAR